MRTVIATATAAVATLAVGCPAQAATYQEGLMSYSASGSYLARGVMPLSCEVAGRDGSVHDVNTTYPVTEKVTFKSGKGVAFYQGDVGGGVFFGGPHEHAAKLSVSVTRTATLPVQCLDAPKPDCGAKQLNGTLASQFGGPVKRGRALDLHVRFAHSKFGSGFDDPYRNCGSEALGAFFAEKINPPTGSAYDFQRKALRYPGIKRFWGHKRLTLSGIARTKERGGPSIELHMKMKLSRRTTKSRHDPRA